MGSKLIALIAVIAVAAMVSVGSTDSVMNGLVQQFYISDLVPFVRPTIQLTPTAVTFLLIDEDSIKAGSPPNNFTEADVNGQVAESGLRTQLPYFASNVGEILELNTGQVGDEGWFAVTSIPSTWTDTGPTDDGLQNFLGINNPVGMGLGIGREPDALLDQISDVTPLGDEQLRMLEGNSICALVYDGDVGFDPETKTANLAGSTLGIVGFQLVAVQALNQTSILPQVTIDILDASTTCGGPLALFTEAADNPTSGQPDIVGEVPQNATNPEGPAQNGTDIVGEVPQNGTNYEVPQNETQQAEPTTSNSTDVSNEPVNDSGPTTGDESAPDEQQTNDNSGNSANDQSSDEGASEEESADDSPDEAARQSTPPEAGAQGQ